MKIYGVIGVFLISGVAAADVKDDVRLAMKAAGLDMRAIQQQVKKGVCGNPEMEQMFDGITLGVSAGIRKGPLKAAVGVEYALFFDVKTQKIRGQAFVYPAVGLELGKSVPVSPQIGVAFGCKGKPENYAGYFASASAYGVAINIGISNDVFDRAGAAVAGVDLKANAPKDFETLVGSFSGAMNQVGQGLAAVADTGVSPRDVRSIFKKSYRFLSPEPRGERDVGSSYALMRFIDDMEGMQRRKDAIVESVKRFRRMIEQAARLPKEQRPLTLPAVQAEYLAVEEELSTIVHRMARFSVQLKRYAHNHPTNHWVFSENRLSRTGPGVMASIGNMVGFGTEDTFRDELTHEELAKGTYRMHMNQIRAINQLVDGSLAAIDTLNQVRAVISNDRADAFQGQAFRPDRKVGGLPQSDKTLSGCNSFSVDPVIFAQSGGPLITAMSGYTKALAAAPIAGMSALKTEIMNPSSLKQIGEAVSRTKSKANASVNFSYYYTPNDIKEVWGIDVSEMLGDGSFEMDIPEAWKEIGDKKALCGEGRPRVGEAVGH